MALTALEETVMRRNTISRRIAQLEAELQSRRDDVAGLLREIEGMNALDESYVDLLVAAGHSPIVDA